MQASPLATAPNHSENPMLFWLLCAPKGGRLAAMSRFSVTGSGAQSHCDRCGENASYSYFDWFHVSMRVRHIEQAFEGIRQLNPN